MMTVLHVCTFMTGGWGVEQLQREVTVCLFFSSGGGREEGAACVLHGGRDGEEHLSARRCGATDAADASEGGDVRACTHGGREFLKRQQIPIRFFQLQP